MRARLGCTDCPRKKNREIPPLDYDRVLRLKAAHPELTIVLNGGITSVAAAAGYLERLDGVMLGRAAYQTPYVLAEADQQLFPQGSDLRARHEVLEALIPYAASHLERGGRLSNITRHVLGLYHGRPRARAFRRHLSERAVRDGAGIEVLTEAIAIAEGGDTGAAQAAE